MGFFSKAKKKLKKAAKSLGHVATHPLDFKGNVKALASAKQELSLSHNIASGSIGKAAFRSSIDFNRQLHNAKASILGKKGAAIEEQIGSGVGSLFTFGATDAAKAVIARKTGRDPHTGEKLYSTGFLGGGQVVGTIDGDIPDVQSQGLSNHVGDAIKTAGRLIDVFGPQDDDQSFDGAPLDGPGQEDVRGERSMVPYLLVGGLALVVAISLTRK